MAFCGSCGASINDGVKFCPACGKAVTGEAPTADEVQADPADVQENKAMAIIAYILFFIPLLTGDYKKSPFVKFHTNQGTILFLAWFAAFLVSSILTVVLIGVLLMPLFGLAVLVLAIIGIINAVNGKMKQLPVIGKYTIIK